MAGVFELPITPTAGPRATNCWPPGTPVHCPPAPKQTCGWGLAPPARRGPLKGGGCLHTNAAGAVARVWRSLLSNGCRALCRGHQRCCRLGIEAQSSTLPASGVGGVSEPLYGAELAANSSPAAQLPGQWCCCISIQPEGCRSTAIGAPGPGCECGQELEVVGGQWCSWTGGG